MGHDFPRRAPWRSNQPHHTTAARTVMAETDSLLKRLVSTFALDFAPWLLGTPVVAACSLPGELPGATVAVDQILQVTVAGRRDALLHVEFQGRRTHAPMQWRMLDYMPRLAATYR